MENFKTEVSGSGSGSGLEKVIYPERLDPDQVYSETGSVTA